ncbi:hypothetical protein Dimus_010627 [Dionaea muscipula]
MSDPRKINGLIHCLVHDLIPKLTVIRTRITLGLGRRDFPDGIAWGDLPGISARVLLGPGLEAPLAFRGRSARQIYQVLLLGFDRISRDTKAVKVEAGDTMAVEVEVVDTKVVEVEAVDTKAIKVKAIKAKRSKLNDQDEAIKVEQIEARAIKVEPIKAKLMEGKAIKARAIEVELIKVKRSR